ncbi:mitochondrial glycoprotein [Limtongia smithiae]|uniref:mitochondrial glycoprotein n=1 Tax=Limtongia smithiae TaxID=1125753 RepID=UPI0034CDD6EE
MASRVFARSLTRSFIARPAIAASSRVYARSFAYTAIAQAKNKVARRPAAPVNPQAALANVLSEEIKYEVDQIKEKEWDSLPEYLDSILKDCGFEIVEGEADQDLVVLKKTMENDAEIIIKFTPSELHDGYGGDFDPEMDEEFEHEKEEEDDEFPGDMEGDASVPGKLYFTKPDVGTLYADLTFQENSLVIDQLSFFSDPTLAKSEQPEDELKKKLKYWGPPFDDLDERVQESVYKYIATYGVNDSLASFVSEYARMTEAKLYLGSLKNLKTFISA